MAGPDRAGGGSGGAVRTSGDDRVRAEISPDPLRPEESRARASAPPAGAVVLFVGTVRPRNRGRRVTGLAYEAYAEMAAEELVRVGDEARRRFGLERLDAVHRVGRLAPGDDAVAVAASAEHRGAAFEATRWVMEELKRRVPIWKQESYVDGTSEWLGDPEARPPAAAARDGGEERRTTSGKPEGA